MANQLQSGIEPSRFDTVLSREPFKGLKAILDSLGPDHEALCAGVNGANSYEELLTKLGYRLTLTNQIHVNDCYARVGATGGIKAVLPYYDAADGKRASVMILQEHFHQIMDYFKRNLIVQVRGMGKATAIDESTYIPRLESTYFEAST